eukprot:8086677-Lingulodinium_polyedra.AAC.1
MAGVIVGETAPQCMRSGLRLHDGEVGDRGNSGGSERVADVAQRLQSDQRFARWVAMPKLPE